MFLNDEQILTLCQSHDFIYPYYNRLYRDIDGRKVISFGLSSFGYDIRLSPNAFQVASGWCGLEDVDVKDINDRLQYSPQIAQTDESGIYFLIPPKSYALGVSLESFNMPDDVVGICVGKSTYARVGMIVNTTPLEPGWKGHLVIELYNTTNRNLRVYAGEGICQVLFALGDRPRVAYNDRKGKYQNQLHEITHARL